MTTPARETIEASVRSRVHFHIDALRDALYNLHAKQIKPIGDRILVMDIDAPEETESGGLHATTGMTDSSGKEFEDKGVRLTLLQNRYDKRTPTFRSIVIDVASKVTEFVAGDVAIMGAHVGHHIRHDNFWYRLVRVQDVIGKADVQ